MVRSEYLRSTDGDGAAETPGEVLGPGEGDDSGVIPVEVIERVIDDLETKGTLYEKYAAIEKDPGIFVGAKSVCRYAAKELRKVLSEYGKSE